MLATYAVLCQQYRMQIRCLLNLHFDLDAKQRVSIHKLFMYVILSKIWRRQMFE